MAILVFLARTARTRVVTANLLLNADWLCHLSFLRVAVRLRQQVVTLFLDFGAVDALGAVFTHGIGFLNRDVGQHEEGNDIFVDFLNHGLEQVE